MTTRRPRAWVDALIGYEHTGTNVLTDLLASATVNLDTITVARIILDLWGTPPTVVSNTSGVMQFEMGICVVTEAAFDVGQTAIPDPRVPADAPARGWLWRGVGAYGFQNLAGGEGENWSFPMHVVADLGAMRKVDRGKLVLVVAKTAVQGSAVNVDVFGIVRTLCLT